MASPEHVERLSLTDARWHAAATPFVAHWLRRGAEHHLVLEAPNWANAKKWGEQAALQAWQTLQSRTEPPPLPGDSGDPGATRLWLVQPGFPLKNPMPLWDEPFSRYAALPRNPPLVHPLFPVYGKDRVNFGVPMSLESARQIWGVPIPLCGPFAS